MTSDTGSERHTGDSVASGHVSEERAVRVVGLNAERLTDWRIENTRNSGLFRALDRRVDVVHNAAPTPPLWQQRLIQLLNVAPERERWRRRAGLSPMMFRARTAAAERELRKHDGTYDVVLQIYCVFSPGKLSARRRFVMYLDVTAALTRREYRAAAPISERAYRSWFEMERATYHAAQRLFTWSSWARASLINDYGIDPARVLVAGAGTNVSLAPLDDRRWDSQIALFVGFDWPRKGGPELLRIWPHVRARCPHAQLWIVGNRRIYGPSGDGIRWFGRLDPKALEEIYAQASVFVLPARFDPFPHALREALGSGLPCITTATGGTAEIVRDGVDSLLVPRDDPSALLAAIVGLLDDPAATEAMGRAGHERIRREVTWDQVADVIAPELRSMASE